MKPKIKSKTLWFFAISALVAVAGVVLQYADMIGLSPRAAMTVALVFTLIQSLGGIWLRTVTTGPLE